MADGLRVMHLASDDHWSGAEAQLYYLAHALVLHPAIQLRILLLQRGLLARRLEEAGLPVEVLSPVRTTLELLKAVRERVRAQQIQILHSHRGRPHLLAGLVGRRQHIPSLRSVSSEPRHCRGLRARLACALDTFGGRHLQQAVTCPAPSLFQQLLRRFPRRPVRIITGGIDIAAVRRRAAAPPSEFREDARFTIGFAAQLEAEQRPDLFLDIADALLAESPQRYRFLMFGNGPLHDAVKTRIGARTAIQSMGFRADLPAWLARLDALVVCSEHGALPTVLLEALALGVPVVAHRVGDIPAILAQGRFGRLVEHQRIDAYLRALHVLAAQPGPPRHDPEVVEHLRRHYNAAATANAYVDLYRRLVC